MLIGEQLQELDSEIKRLQVLNSEVTTLKPNRKIYESRAGSSIMFLANSAVVKRRVAKDLKKKVKERDDAQR